MSNCTVEGCHCLNFYYDWNVDNRSANCEDCQHEKRHHRRPEQGNKA